MIREHLFDKRVPADPLFRWRGGNVSRLEGFSDGVFAVILTLLVASTSVPSTFQELWLTIRDLPVFLVTFLFMLVCWHDHYIYFRRYGFEDGVTKVLNGAFLFLIVFFAFPLKFMATFLWRIIQGGKVDAARMFEPLGDRLPADQPPLASWLDGDLNQRIAMMAFYGVGAIGVYGVLSLMTWRAHRFRDRLQLDAIERHITLHALAHHMVMVITSVVSLVVLFATRNAAFSGIVYFVLGPVHGVVGWWGGRKTNQLKKQLEAS